MPIFFPSKLYYLQLFNSPLHWQGLWQKIVRLLCPLTLGCWAKNPTKQVYQESLPLMSIQSPFPLPLRSNQVTPSHPWHLTKFHLVIFHPLPHFTHWLYSPIWSWVHFLSCIAIVWPSTTVVLNKIFCVIFNKCTVQCFSLTASNSG